MPAHVDTQDGRPCAQTAFGDRWLGEWAHPVRALLQERMDVRGRLTMNAANNHVDPSMVFGSRRYAQQELSICMSRRQSAAAQNNPGRQTYGYRSTITDLSSVRPERCGHSWAA